MIFSPEQEMIISKAIEMINSNDKDLFEISGIAGSGKTTIVSEIIRRSGVKNVIGCALSGQAVSVLQSKGINARTIHSLIYELVLEASDKRDEYLDVVKLEPVFKRKERPLNIDLLIIDEAYMIDESIASDLKSLKHIKKIACGDCFQLPPISGNPGFLTSDNIFRLTKPFRTDSISGIYLLSNDIINNVNYLNKEYNNVKFINKEDITDKLLLEHDVILTCTNSTRNEFNNRIRKIKFFSNRKETILPIHGERVIFKRNNLKIKFGNISLVNGMTGVVIGEAYMNDKNSFTIYFKPDLVDDIVPIKCDYNYFTGSVDKKNLMKRYSKYRNGEYLEFSYASTIHSYQGSQAPKCLYIDESYLFKPDVRKALVYTAVTRASESITFCRY